MELSSHFEISLARPSSFIHGTTLDRTKITCVDCIESSQTRKHSSPTDTYYETKLFPHYVVIGNEHVDPSEKLIEKVNFTVSDMSSIFYDFDTFGISLDAPEAINAVLAKNRAIRPVEVGEWPEIAYFTGKMTVIEVETVIGIISVRHRPSFSMGGPDGVYMKNKMFMSIEPTAPLNLRDAIDHIALIRRFLTIVAGRPQAVTGIELKTMSSDEARRPLLQLHWSYAPKGPQNDEDKPSPSDLPLDAVGRPEEFSNVFKAWIASDERWKIARNRYVGCIEKGNAYGVDRLVAAANMFDLLPAEAIPPPTPLPDDLGKLRSECIANLKKLPQSQDRDSAIGALSRMGRPSLPKKVLYRSSLIRKHIDPYFPDLDDALKLAVKCRNHFVHGESDTFDFSVVERFVPFLTDALEFVFATSDLVETGWDADRWAHAHYSGGHTFARFRWGYNERVAQLKQAMEASK